MPASEVWEHDVVIPMGVDGTVVDLLFRPHLAHLPFMTSLARNVWLRGDRGSAKSKHGIWLMHTLARRYPGFRYMVVRRQYSELDQNFLLDLPDDLDRMGGEPLGYKFEKQKHRAIYPNKSRGFFRPCDTERDLRKVLGLEYHAVLVDESPELPWQWIVKIGTSLRKPKDLGIPIPPLMRLLGNLKGESIDEHYRFFRVPDEETGEIEDDVLDEPAYDPADWVTWFVSLSDNPSLDEGEYRKRFVGLDAATRAAWLEGKRWRAAPLFGVTRAHKVETVENANVTGVARVYRSFVPGLVEADPAVCLWVAKRGPWVTALCERVWTGATVETMVAEMRAVEAGFRERGWPVPSVTYAPDRLAMDKPDVFDFAAELERQRVPVTPIKEDLDQVTRRIHRWLATPEALRVLVGPRGAPVGCPKLWRALPRQQADEKHPSRMVIRPDSGPVRALGQFLMSEAAAATGLSARRVEPPAWWKFRPVNRTRKM